MNTIDLHFDTTPKTFDMDPPVYIVANEISSRVPSVVMKLLRKHDLLDKKISKMKYNPLSTEYTVLAHALLGKQVLNTNFIVNDIDRYTVSKNGSLIVHQSKDIDKNKITSLDLHYYDEEGDITGVQSNNKDKAYMIEKKGRSTTRVYENGDVVKVMQSADGSWKLIGNGNKTISHKRCEWKDNEITVTVDDKLAFSAVVSY